MALTAFRLLLTLFFLMNLCVNSGFAQTSSDYLQFNDGSSPIVWIDQIPSLTQNKQTATLRTWFSNVLFGVQSNALIKPFAMVGSKSDSLWVLDQGSGSVLHYNKGLGQMPEVYLNNSQPFPSLIACCWLNSEHLLFTDSRLNQVFVLNTNSGETSIFCQVELQQPTGIACSVDGTKVWVVETAAHRISVFDNTGHRLKTIGSRGTDSGLFNFPTYLCSDKADHFYVVDAMNFRIQRFDSLGNFQSTFGQAGDATGYLARPKGIAIDTFGHIYIVDALFHTVQIFDQQGKFLYNFGNQGRGNGQFWMPSGIYIDELNTIYMADTYNARIQIFQLNEQKN